MADELNQIKKSILNIVDNSMYDSFYKTLDCDDVNDRFGFIKLKLDEVFYKINNLLAQETASKEVANTQHQRALLLLDERNAELKKMEAVLREKESEIAHLRGECKSFTAAFDMVFRALLEVSNEKT